MASNPIPVITIDGTAGTGKGTIAKLLAQELGWHYLDSGALYRVLGFAAVEHKVTLDDEQALVDLAKQFQLEFTIDDAKNLHILLNNNDISEKIRDPAISEAASKISALPLVRQMLLNKQHDFRMQPGLVTDGRDMGTVVFPDAMLKFFFTASPEERAQRRYNQLKQQGNHVNLQAILQSIMARDERDQSRVASPLKPADDAIVVDTTSLNIDDVFTRVLASVKAVV